VGLESVFNRDEGERTSVPPPIFYRVRARIRKKSAGKQVNMKLRVSSSCHRRSLKGSASVSWRAWWLEVSDRVDGTTGLKWAAIERLGQPCRGGEGAKIGQEKIDALRIIW